MKNNVKELYRDIKPSQELKEKCLKVQRKSFRLKNISTISAAAACALVILGAGAFGVNAYFTPSVSAMTQYTATAYARTETVVMLSVKTHTAVTVSVQEGSININGSDLGNSITLSDSAQIGWHVDEDATSPVLTVTKTNGDSVVYRLAKTENGGWKLVK